MAKSQQKTSGEAVEPLVEKAFDKKFSNEELAEAVSHLTADQAAMLMVRLEAALKKRKIQLTGYLVALVIWLVGMVFALAYFGASEGFTGWVFLVPFGFVGLILYAFGKWGEAVGKAGADAADPSKSASKPKL